MSSTQYKPFSTIPTSPFICTTPYAQRNEPYTDTPRSQWEAHNVSVARKAAALRNDIAAMNRTLAKMEALNDSTPAPDYSHEQAIADAQAAGLRYHVARRISLDAVAAGLTGAEYRAYVDAHIDMHKDAQAATRARNAAKWAQVQAVGA